MAEEKSAPVPTAKPLVPRKLPEARFNLAETAHNTFFIVPEEGTPADAMLDPAYWAHVGFRLRPTDIIEAVPDDGSWYARFIVRNAGHLFAEVALLEHVPLGAAQTKPDATADHFKVEWKGPHWKHSVIRLSDNEAVKTGFETKEAAQRYLFENSRTLIPAKAAA